MLGRCWSDACASIQHDSVTNLRQWCQQVQKQWWQLTSQPFISQDGLQRLHLHGLLLCVVHAAASCRLCGSLAGTAALLGKTDQCSADTGRKHRCAWIEAAATALCIRTRVGPGKSLGSALGARQPMLQFLRLLGCTLLTQILLISVSRTWNRWNLVIESSTLPRCVLVATASEHYRCRRALPCPKAPTEHAQMTFTCICVLSAGCVRSTGCYMGRYTAGDAVYGSPLEYTFSRQL